MTSVITECYDCGSTYSETAMRCECGEPLWFKVELEGYSWDDVDNESSLWRYHDVFPVGHQMGIGSHVGCSPLIRTNSLDELAGCDTWVKWEGSLPTGAYKDRGSAVGVSHSVELGNEWVGTVSYGNMAMSTAAHATSANVGCIILAPPDMPEQRLPFIAQYDPHIIEVSGDYGQLYHEALNLRKNTVIDFLNADPPSRIAGYKTCIYEICEDLRPNVPDAIVAPASAGGLGSGIWKGLKELSRWGMIDSMPRLYFAQTAASDPITQAFENGSRTVNRLTPAEVEDTIAHSIGNPNPPSGNRVLAAARNTGGAVLSVTDDELIECQRLLAQKEGICVEPSSATVLAASKQLHKKKEIHPEDRVVMVASGSGFKELDSTQTGDPTIQRTTQDGLLEATENVIRDKSG